MENNDEKILIEAGLSEEQAAVYASLIDRGPQKASNLSRWTGIKRGLIYKVLEQMEIMGLVSKKGGEGTVAVFSPEHPSNLADMMERKARAIELAKETVLYSLGSLSSKYNLLSGKPNVQFYEGNEAIKKITGDLPENDKEIRQWVDVERAMKQFPEDTVGYLNKRVEKGISKKIILSDSEYNKNYANKEAQLTEYKVGSQQFPTAIQVYDNKVTLLTLDDDKKIGLIIEDASIADAFKNIFDGYWAK